MFLQTSLAFLSVALGLAAAGHALLHKSKPQSAFGWIVLCLILPVAGALLYYVFGINRVKTLAKRLRSRQSQSIVEPATDVHPPPEVESLAKLGLALTGVPLVGANSVEMLHNGEQAYPAMLRAIRQASRRVFVSTYIFDNDAVGREFTTALGEAATRGADVRVLLDGIGQHYSFPSVRRLLREAGVRHAHFLPPKLFPPAFQINLRNHRKILVTDDETAFVGGMNVSDRHLVETDNPSRVVDLHFRCRGPIVTQITSVFLQDWQFVTGESFPLAPSDPAAGGSAFCRAVADGPQEDLDRLAELLVGAIGGAQHQVSIMTPYFLPPRELIATLQVAALRGVDVAVILPAQNNLPYVHWATRRMLLELLQHNVRIYYQPPPFVHSKLFVVDGHYALIGSANIDPRSLRLNFELTVEVYDSRFADELHRHFQAVRTRSSAVTLEDVNRLSLATRLVDSVAWLFSPYL